MLNLTSNGRSFAQKLTQPPVKKELPDDLKYSLLDHIQAGYTYDQIIKLGLCPKDYRPALRKFINSYSRITI